MQRLRCIQGSGRAWSVCVLFEGCDVIMKGFAVLGVCEPPQCKVLLDAPCSGESLTRRGRG